MQGEAVGGVGVADGYWRRQRLTAAYNFLKGGLRLEGLKVWKELNGLTYDKIQQKGFAATIERRLSPASRRVMAAANAAAPSSENRISSRR